MKLYLVHMAQPVCGKFRRVGPYPVAAENPVQAAEYFLSRIEETSPDRLRHWQSCRVYVCEYVWDGTAGFKIAANTNGDIRYDVRRGKAGYWPVHSEKSFA